MLATIPWDAADPSLDFVAGLVPCLHLPPPSPQELHLLDPATGVAFFRPVGAAARGEAMASSSTASMDSGDAPSSDHSVAQQQAPPEALTAERTPSSPDNLVSCSFDMLVRGLGKGTAGCVWASAGGTRKSRPSPATQRGWGCTSTRMPVPPRGTRGWCLPPDIVHLAASILGRSARTGPAAWCAASWSAATPSCRHVLTSGPQAPACLRLLLLCLG